MAARDFTIYLFFFLGSVGFLGFFFGCSFSRRNGSFLFVLCFFVEFLFLSVVYQLVVVHYQYHSFYITLSLEIKHYRIDALRLIHQQP